MRKLFLILLILPMGCASDLRKDRLWDDHFDKKISAQREAKPAPEIHTLSLDQAIQLAEKRSPQLASKKYAVDEARAWVSQAGAWDNPTIFAGKEGITSDKTPGGDQAQDLIGMSYPIPLGNPKSAATARAKEELRLAEANYELSVRDVRVSVSQAFASALFDQEKYALTKREKEVRGQLLDLAKALHQAGDIAEQDVDRVQLEAGHTALALLEAEGARDQAYRTLASEIGDRALVIREVKGEVTLPVLTLTFAELEKRILSDSPLARKWEAERAAALGRVREAQAQGWPTLTLSGAYRKYAETDQDTFDVMAELPLPIFDRNQGTIEAARVALSRTKRNILGEVTRTLAKLQNHFRELKSLSDQLKIYRETLLPTAEKAFELHKTLYEKREISTLELLDSERALLQARLGALKTARSYHRIAAEILGRYKN